MKIVAKIADSLSNLLTGMGIHGMDKSKESYFEESKMSHIEMENAYDSDWLSGKVCNLPPFDMTRAWRTMNGAMTPEMKVIFLAEEKRLGVQAKIKESLTWGRVYGGAGILINVDDGNLSSPINKLEIDKIKKGGLKYLIVLDRQFLHLGRINHSPLSAGFGYPETYRMSQASEEIHHSRICRFEGIPLPLSSRRRNGYWGKSVIESLQSPLKRAAEVQESVGTLIHEATVDVIKIPDLMETVSSDDTKSALISRLATAKMQKSINRMLIIDSEEEYESKSHAFSGVTDIMEKMLSIPAGAADIPITRLLGSSPSGLNSSGESDLRNYYDMLSSRQELELRPTLEYLDQIIFASLFGREAKEDELNFTFNPLLQMSEKEISELQVSNSNRDNAYMTSNVINEAIVAKSLMENNVYSGIDSEYIEELNKIINGDGPEEDEDEETEKTEEIENDDI